MSENPKRRLFSKRDLFLGAPAVGLAWVHSADLSKKEGNIDFVKGMNEKSSPDARLFSDPTYATQKFMGSKKHMINLRSAKENFLNVGVVHFESHLNTQLNETPLGSALKTADIILLEWSRANGYFSQISVLKKQGAQAYNIDTSNNFFSQLSNILLFPWVLARLGKDFATQDFSTKFQRFLITLGLSNSTVGLMDPLGATAIYSSIYLDNNSTRYFPNHLVDGRTVFMSLAIKEIMNEPTNKGKKILVITGDTHAEIIDKYLFTNHGELEVKGYLYNLFFGFMKFFESKM